MTLKQYEELYCYIHCLKLIFDRLIIENSGNTAACEQNDKAYRVARKLYNLHAKKVGGCGQQNGRNNDFVAIFKQKWKELAHP